MIQSRHNKFIYPFFQCFSCIIIKLYFKKIIITGNIKKNCTPTLIIANHFSWWDGFFIAALNKKRFHKKFHILMLEEQLKKHLIFSYAGAFSIKKNSKGILESLNYGVQLLQHPNNLLVFFPQGKFDSLYQYPFHFQNGLIWLLQHLQNEIQLLFVANQVEYFNSPHPSLYIHYKEYKFNNKNINHIENDYNIFFKTCYLKNQ